MWNRSQGFTLFECVATLILLGLMAVVAVSITSAFRYKAEQSALVQTDVFAASSCIERAKALSFSGEFESVMDKFQTKSACKNVSSITITPLTTPSQVSNNTVSTVKIEPASTSTSRLYLVTVKAGSVELNYVAR